MPGRTRRRYRKRPDQFVTAIKLDLDTTGFTYRKWGAVQTCKAGDWLVENHGDVYTVDAEVFARTYRQVGPGTYLKTTPIWAERASEAGSVATKEGRSFFDVGDYLVANDEEGADVYTINAGKFETMYELDEPD